MRFGFDEITYKKIYLKYVWISIAIAFAVVVLQYVTTNYLDNIEIIGQIIFPFFVICMLYLIFCFCTGLPFVIYVSTKNLFKMGHILIEENHLWFIRACNIVDSPNDIEDRKYKKTKYFNVEKITETKWCYKIKGEIDYYYEKPADGDEKPTIKHKKGTFKIPKCFGEEKEFKENLFKLVHSQKIQTESVNNEEYSSITVAGLLDLIICVASFLILLFGTGSIVIIAMTIAGYEAIRGINTIREKNRDRFISVINIILGIVGFILVVISMAS